MSGAIGGREVEIHRMSGVAQIATPDGKIPRRPHTSIRSTGLAPPSGMQPAVCTAATVTTGNYAVEQREGNPPVASSSSSSHYGCPVMGKKSVGDEYRTSKHSNVRGKARNERGIGIVCARPFVSASCCRRDVALRSRLVRVLCAK
jgi:hypothetical protein